MQRSRWARSLRRAVLVVDVVVAMAVEEQAAVAMGAVQWAEVAMVEAAVVMAAAAMARVALADLLHTHALTPPPPIESGSLARGLRLWIGTSYEPPRMATTLRRFR